MSSFVSLLSGKGTATEIFIIGLTALLGVLIGRIEIGKVKLGITGVLFAGLLLGSLGDHVQDHVLHFVREFGLILYVYAVGVEVGPRFFSSFKSDGLKMNLLAATNVVLGFAVALVIFYAFKIPLGVITGVVCGAVTNVPALGAAQQAMSDQVGQSNNVMSMGCAAAYPFGIIGVILAMILLRWFFRIKLEVETKDYTNGLHGKSNKLESVRVVVTNPNLFGQNLKFIRKMIDGELVISRIARNGNFLVANDQETLLQGDALHGVTSTNSISSLNLKMGSVEIAENHSISGDIALFHVLVTNRKIAGHTIFDIGLNSRHCATITRIIRGGMEILPTPDTTLELGDTVRIVGKRDSQDDVRKELGNSVKELAIPNTIPIFIGIFLGILLGSIAIPIPGLPVPAKLGMAGGPLLVAILLGYKTRVGKLDFYMTPGANMMLRELGIVLFLACVGLSAGGDFFKTMCEGGWVWMVYGAVITFVPVMIVGIFARLLKWNYFKICGVLAGAMTDPPALEYANSLSSVQAQSTAYATVYPLTMFLRVLLAQLLVLIFI